MEQFLNPKAIEFEMQDVNGEIKQFTVKHLTSDVQKAIAKLGENNTEVDLIYKQMALLCGGTAKDYEVYDTRVLSKVMIFITEEIQNPT